MFFLGVKNFIEAMAALNSKPAKAKSVIEEVFGSGEMVTCRAKGTIAAKDGSFSFETK